MQWTPTLVQDTSRHHVPRHSGLEKRTIATAAIRNNNCWALWAALAGAIPELSITPDTQRCSLIHLRGLQPHHLPTSTDTLLPPALDVLLPSWWPWTVRHQAAPRHFCSSSPGCQTSACWLSPQRGCSWPRPSPTWQGPLLRRALTPFSSASPPSPSLLWLPSGTRCGGSGSALSEQNGAQGGTTTPEFPLSLTPARRHSSVRAGGEWGGGEGGRERAGEEGEEKGERSTASAHPSARRASTTTCAPAPGHLSRELCPSTAIVPAPPLARFGPRPGIARRTTYPSSPSRHRARVLSARRALPSGTCSPHSREGVAAQGRCRLRRAEEPWPGRAGAACSPSPPSGRGSAVPGRAAGDGEEASAVLRSCGAGWAEAWRRGGGGAGGGGEGGCRGGPRSGCPEGKEPPTMEIENIVANTVLLKAREGESRGARRRGRRSGSSRQGGLRTCVGGGKGSEVRGKGAREEGERKWWRRRGWEGGEAGGQGSGRGGDPSGWGLEPARGGQRVPGSAPRHLPRSSRGIRLELLLVALLLEKHPFLPSPLILIVFLPDVLKGSLICSSQFV